MPEGLRNILNRIKEWWLKFTTRQKAIIVSLGVIVVIAFIVVISIISKPQYEVLITCESTKSSSEVTSILESAGITDYKLSSNALVISVKAADKPSAELALGASGFMPDDYSLETAQNSSFSDTTSDKNRRYQLYLENKLTNTLKSIDGIRGAKVSFHIPEDTGTLISQREEPSAYIQLDTDTSFNAGNAAYIAKAVASFLGCETTANITILSSDGTMLFVGGDDYTSAGIANSMQELQNTAEAYVANQAKKVLYGTSQYNNIEVTGHLNMDYGTYEKAVKLYYSNEGRDEGMKTHEETFESESSSGTGGVPGTDSNGEGTTYMYQNAGESSSSSSEKLVDYAPNESSTYSTIPAGVIDYSKSSISIAAIHYNELSEEDAKTMGLLDGITWDEYKLANNRDTKLEVDEEFYTMVANATGIPVENITIVAYESPLFYDKASLAINWTTVLSVALFILILALLVIVVLRSMGAREEVVQEEEVSVENLLQSNPEPTVEDIDVEAKSETRKMVEKFVDDNPESAALLLRSWLTEDWG